MTEQIKGPKIAAIEQRWDSLSKTYEAMDSNPQTFYYTLVNMLKLDQAKNILEVGCGCGRLLTYATTLKKKQCPYYATDLSQRMLQILRVRLQNTLEHFQSKLSVEQWCQKNNLIIKKVNNEQKVETNIKFDRIISNLVLMLTQDAQKMLQSLHEQAEQGCLMGITIWGQKSRNNFHNVVSQVIEDMQLTVPKSRSNHYLFKKVEGLLEKTGWEIVLNWQQDVPMSYFESKQALGYFQYVVSQYAKFTQQQRDKLLQESLLRISKTLQSKQTLNFPCQCLIVRKNKNK